MLRRLRRAASSLAGCLAGSLTEVLGDPAVKAAAVAVVINVLVRAMEVVFANPWDPMIQNALGFYTVWTLVQIMTKAPTYPQPPPALH